MLAKIGIKVNLVVAVEVAALPADAEDPPESDFYLLGWGVPTYDSALHLQLPLPHARQARTAAGTGPAIPIRKSTS